MGIEGRLNIALRTNGGVVKGVLIESSRPVHASQVFHGKPVSEALRMLPMLFSVCGTAQSWAGVQACEQALGVCAPPGLEALRAALVRLETEREHLWRILLDWPGFIGEPPRQSGMAEMLRLQKEYRQVMTGRADPFAISGTDAVPEQADAEDLSQRLDAVLGREVFGRFPRDWLAISRSEALWGWASSGDTVAARVLGYVMQSGWSGVGSCEVTPLPLLERGRLHQLMANEAFVEKPVWLDECCETTCLTRVDTPLIAQLKRQYGNGLLVRLVARLTELAQLAGRLLPAPAVATRAEIGNPGIGQARAARGHLLHRVQLQQGRVVRYQILAPTEWNFHPQGVVAQSLARLSGAPDQIEQQARLLINAIDPCVAYELSIG